MLSSVVSTIAICLGIAGGGDLNERELKAWRKIQPSVIYLQQGSIVCGTAALIDRDGLFLAHRTAVSSKSIDARMTDGTKVKLTWIATDDPTQFVLLKADDWKSEASPIGIANSDVDKPLLALTSTGPVRAERAGSTYGIVNPSRKVMPMSELRFENNIPSLGGALLVDLNGNLAGAINAALELTPSQNYQKSRGGDQNQGFGAGGPGGAGGGRYDTGSRSGLQQFGPGVMTTAYTIGPKVLKRVIEGFRSESHIVKHPAIGIFCRDAIPNGALIDSVTPGSKAEEAGLAKNDVISMINGKVVTNQIDFARIMVDEEIGDVLTIWILRGGLKQQVKVVVGSN